MFAKNIVSGAFRSLHCLIYKVLARPPQRRNVLYLTTSFGFCQALFSTFSKFFRRLPRLSAALSDSPSSISELPEFVKSFFYFVLKFQGAFLSAYRRSQIAHQVYQSFQSLSSTFFTSLKSFRSLAGTTAAFQTACLLYQTLPHLSTGIFQIFQLFFKPTQRHFSLSVI